MKKNQERSQRPYCGSVENFLNGTESEKSKQTKENPDEFNRVYKVIVDKPWEYDFKYEYFNNGRKGRKREEDCTKFWNLDEEPNVIKRLLKYKADDNGFDCDGTGDKDVCELTREIYRRLWDWKDICNNQKQRYGTIGSSSIPTYGPDTMNSFMTLFCNVLKEEKGRNAGKTILDDHRDFIVQTYKLKEQRYVSSLFLYRLLVEQEEKRKVKLEDYLNDDLKLWRSYAKICHVIGNFVLVPAGFNPKRSNMFKDFWDLSLLYLKGQVKDNIWLSSSNLFVKYINYFFLWDYVICNDDRFDYYIKSEFSDNFTSANEYRSDLLVSPDRQMPNKTEISNFIENAQWAVKRRGIFMTAMLRLQSEKSDEYDRLRREIFAADKCYDGYKEVIEKISKKIALPSTVKDILREEPEWAEIKELQETQEKNVNE